jgi:hypothetical protein
LDVIKILDKEGFLKSYTNNSLALLEHVQNNKSLGEIISYFGKTYPDLFTKRNKEGHHPLATVVCHLLLSASRPKILAALINTGLFPINLKDRPEMFLILADYGSYECLIPILVQQGYPLYGISEMVTNIILESKLSALIAFLQELRKSFKNVI